MTLFYNIYNKAISIFMLVFIEDNFLECPIYYHYS